jgi:hypothetical protein
MSNNQMMKVKAMSAKSAPKKTRVTRRFNPVPGPRRSRFARPLFALSFEV